LHDLFVNTEAVTPGEYKSRGAGLTIRYGLHPTPFGECLIAATERGICHLSFVQTSEGNTIDNLVADWKQAKMVEDYNTTAPLIARIFANPNLDSAFNKANGFPLQGLRDTSRKNRAGLLNPALSLHLRGTNFQIKVWEALLNIPTGAVTTYEHIAVQIGIPKAIRAVGTAVGHNPIAVLVPCHRVIRKAGEFGNYRYGSARKKALLVKEYSQIA
jgi:AraC family transcriptional regulator, regulatory protein of adaptative response / methylated-DNA-[protein]-cysteine methyltransferase